MRVLLWKLGALGDVVMTTPLVRQLRRRHPDARIDYLVGQSAQAALAGNPYLDTVHCFDETILVRRRASRLAAIVARLRGYDVVYVLDKHWIFGLLALAARVPLRIGFRRRAHEGPLLSRTVRYGSLRHEIDYYLDLLEAAETPADRNDLALEPPGAAAGPQVGDAVILINSGGANANESSLVRRMPDGLFGALVEECVARAPVVFLGTASEAVNYERYTGAARSNLCGRTSLAEATGLMRGAGRIVTTDNGLMHLGAAVNPRVTAVFGPTHPLRKCPPCARWAWADEDRYDPRYELFGRLPHGEWFGRLTVEDVLEHARPSPLAGRVGQAA
jgi:ADP-heptose:LPS heptosyltransferase